MKSNFNPHATWGDSENDREDGWGRGGTGNGKVTKGALTWQGLGAGVAEGERDLGGDEESVTRAGATLANVHQMLSGCHMPFRARHLNPTVYPQKHR